jgi:hypothetical protein
MIIIDLIKILAEVCRYNANGKIYIHINGKTIPMHHCIDDFIDIDNTRERVITLVPEGDDYYGK